MSAILLRPTELNTNVSTDAAVLEPLCREVDSPNVNTLLAFALVPVLILVSAYLGWPYAVLVATGLVVRRVFAHFDAATD